MKKLYNDQFVKKELPRRNCYLIILNSVVGKTCPVCGICIVSSLDHYLPKSLFPCLAVLPANLYPSCSWCNSEKDTYVAEAKNKQLLHPYFDESCELEWFQALLSIDSVFYFKIKVKPLNNEELLSRLEMQLQVYSLNELYSMKLVQKFTDRLSYLKSIFLYSGTNTLIKELFNSYNDSISKNLGILEVAFYKALLCNPSFLYGDYFSITRISIVR
ncbi:hypothetical protein ABMA70_05700 [Halobacteriovorax sp. XZX-3]